MASSTTSPAETPPRVFIIHDHAAWIEPLQKELSSRGIPFESWDLSKSFSWNFGKSPPNGVFLNRVSPSSHERGCPHSMDQAATLVRMLETHGRKVLNGTQALAMDMSKSAADTSLQQSGVEAPTSVAVFGKSAEAVREALRAFPPSSRFVVKPNRGGSGVGVRILRSAEAVQAYFASDDFYPSVDGVSIVQEYVPSAESCLYRLEFVDARFVYAVRVDTSDAIEGKAVNNCPADSCDLSRRRAAQKRAAESAVAEAIIGVPVGTACPLKATTKKFQIVPFDQPALIERLERFMRANGVAVGAVEVIQGPDGVFRVIDVNSTNTNYNMRSERRAKRRRLLSRPGGWETVASLLDSELKAQYPAASAASSAGEGVGASMAAGASNPEVSAAAGSPSARPGPTSPREPSPIHVPTTATAIAALA